MSDTPKKAIDPNKELWDKIDDPTKLYEMSCRCTNCDLTGVIRQKKGRKIDTRYTPCANCGCATLVKVSIV